MARITFMYVDILYGLWVESQLVRAVFCIDDMVTTYKSHEYDNLM